MISATHLLNFIRFLKGYSLQHIPIGFIIHSTCQSGIYKQVQVHSWAPAIHEMGSQASYTHLQGRVKDNFNLCLCLWKMPILRQTDNSDQESTDFSGEMSNVCCKHLNKLICFICSPSLGSAFYS